MAYMAVRQFFLAHSVQKRTAGELFEVYIVNTLSWAVYLSWKLCLTKIL
jgi:hypothetical protein